MMQPSASPSAGWREVDLAGMRLWQSGVFAEFEGVVHVFTGRGRNMSVTHGPNRARAEVYRRAICDALGLGGAWPVVGRQIHGTRVARVASATGQRPGTRIIPDVDGLITTVVGQPLMALSADCPLILLYDARRRALGLAHSGWRSTVEKMPVRLVEAMASELGAAPADLVGVIAPAAGGCCYEIGDDVIARVLEVARQPDRHLAAVRGRTHLHLASLIAEQLERAGMAPGRVHIPEQCTICDGRFCSYRRDGHDTEHAAMVAAMI
jgi:YfiH family protein